MTSDERATLRVLVWQVEPGHDPEPAELGEIAEWAPRVIVLPEYFWVRTGDVDARASSRHMADDLRRLGRISASIPGVWVGGTVVEPGPGGAFFNTAPVFENGVEITRYRKRHLMPGESRAGLTPGANSVVARSGDVSVGLLICADVLHPETYYDLARNNPDVIAVPTNSPHRPDDPLPAKSERDQAYFVDGARRTGAFVLKACTVGEIFGRPVQGRSLIAGPEGIVTGATPEQEGERLFLKAELGPAGFRKR